MLDTIESNYVALASHIPSWNIGEYETKDACVYDEEEKINTAFFYAAEIKCFICKAYAESKDRKKVCLQKVLRTVWCVHYHYPLTSCVICCE